MTEDSDAVEIKRLLGQLAYAAGFAADLDEYAALMTADVVIEFVDISFAGVASVTHHGRDEARAGAESRRVAGVQSPGTHTLHVVSNIVVHPAQGPCARSAAYWRYYRMQHGCLC